MAARRIPLEPELAQRILKHDSRTNRLLQITTAVFMLVMFAGSLVQGQSGGISDIAWTTLALAFTVPLVLEGMLQLQRYRVTKGLYGTWLNEASHAQDLARRGFC